MAATFPKTRCPHMHWRAPTVALTLWLRALEARRRNMEKPANPIGFNNRFKHKTLMCRYWEAGHCFSGARCRWRRPMAQISANLRTFTQIALARSFPFVSTSMPTRACWPLAHLFPGHQHARMYVGCLCPSVCSCGLSAVARALVAGVQHRRDSGTSNICVTRAC